MRWPGSLVANKAAVSVMEQRWGGRQSESPLSEAMTDKLPPPHPPPAQNGTEFRRKEICCCLLTSTSRVGALCREKTKHVATVTTFRRSGPLKTSFQRKYQTSNSSQTLDLVSFVPKAAFISTLSRCHILQQVERHSRDTFIRHSKEYSTGRRVS